MGKTREGEKIYKYSSILSTRYGELVQGITDSNKTKFLKLDNNGNITISTEGNEISVQYPLPCDGDSVYCKDIDIDNSDIGNFSGDVCDLFDSLKSLISNTTSDNPKSIKICMHTYSLARVHRQQEWGRIL